MKRRGCPHVHLRGENGSRKSTIAEGLELAEKQGLSFVIDMPNNDPPTVDADGVRRRLALVPVGSPVKYFTYVGLTSNRSQILEAVECWNNFPQVAGLKMFAGQSNKSMSVTTGTEQLMVYHALADFDYRGVIAVHCESELLLKPALWNPSKPSSHSFARPKEAEIASIQDQIEFAADAGFLGTLHICHVSCPESARIIHNYKQNLSQKLKITCGVTPHHLLFSYEMMDRFLTLGNFLKVNPPLRSEEDRVIMRELLKAAYFDFIETDHAPHASGENMLLSGIPTLHLYKDFISELEGELHEYHLDCLTFDNIVRTFAPKLDHLLVS